jgi:hypothetical protein
MEQPDPDFRVVKSHGLARHPTKSGSPLLDLCLGWEFADGLESMRGMRAETQRFFFPKQCVHTEGFLW